MSTKRQPSKQRRQTQNQRQRAALQARRANAAAAEVPDGKVGGDASTSRSGGGAGSLLSRLRGATGTSPSTRTTRTTRTPSARGGSMATGQRAALSALLAAAAAAVVGALLIQVPIGRDDEPLSGPPALVAEWSLSALEAVEDGASTPDEVIEAVDEWSPAGRRAYGPASFPLSLGLLLPGVGAALAFRAVTNRSPAKIVTRTMYVTLFGTLLTGRLFPVFLPTVAGVAIAAFQVRKAELATNAAAASDDDGVPLDADDDDIIEVEEAMESDQLIDAEEVIEEDDVDVDVDDGADADEDQRSV